MVAEAGEDAAEVAAGGEGEGEGEVEGDNREVVAVLESEARWVWISGLETKCRRRSRYTSMSVGQATLRR